MTSVLAARRRTVAVAVEMTSALAAWCRSVAVAVEIAPLAAHIENQTAVVGAEYPPAADGANRLVAAVESQTAAAVVEWTAVVGPVEAVGKHPQRHSRR